MVKTKHSVKNFQIDAASWLTKGKRRAPARQKVRRVSNVP
jgi:hypothetical protein